eukprot:COSAG01_NODE_37430_length_503_cov_12.705446_2_plen_53_part_00
MDVATVNLSGGVAVGAEQKRSGPDILDDAQRERITTATGAVAAAAIGTEGSF